MSSRNSFVISVPSAENDTKKKNRSSLLSLIIIKKGTYDTKQLIHSIKVGIALALVSLLYLVEPLFDQVGENAMWAIMTVVVVFEFFAGATLSKGLNRGMGTVLGGLLGCLAAMLAQEVGGTARAATVGTSVFIFGAAATYFRLVPSIKKKYDYGVLIFILTFNLVVVSGLRGEQTVVLARERLATIVIGFVICMLTSLLIFPMWASDELHCSTVTKFNNLATSIEGCLEVYFKTMDENNKSRASNISDGYMSVLHSKSKDDNLANFAKWEPWHGKFGFNHPWDKYLYIGDLLRELATSIISLKGCLQSPPQPSMPLRLSIKDPCEAVSSFLVSTLRELGDSIMNMRRSRPGAVIIVKLQSTRLELREAISALGTVNGDGLATVSFVFLLMEMMGKVEKLVKEVEELGDLAGFLP
ncbi:hypothetical protein IFM89_017521 [Coptis chinensis]|uniref:Aluminum-activated malate transporter n=1 Tax=Coptis chinensis TaxID=261450 RepID=A0A835HWJ0_9MAGN|nr:hypothetical protein IFM89_017521 [Coptis chinensis]